MAARFSNIDFGILDQQQRGLASNTDGDRFPKLRDYQEVLFRKASQGNIIICLPTGTGKTLIAVNLIRSMLKDTVGTFPGVAKRTFFLAPTRELVDQQIKVIKNLLPEANACSLTGDNGVDLFNPIQWNKYFKDNQILAFTPAVLERAISKGAIKMEHINLLIFDEAHHVLKKKNKNSGHPYATLMYLYKQSQSFSKPKILGLTASVVNSQVQAKDMDRALRSIENLYNAKLASCDVGDYLNEAEVIEVYYYNEIHTDWNVDFNYYNLYEWKCLEREICYAADLRKLIEKIGTVLNELGPWFALETIKLYRKSLPNLYQQIGRLFGAVFDRIQHSIEARHQPSALLPLEKISGKLNKLLGLLVQMKDDLRGFVFVKERIDANLIYRWLDHLSKTNSKFSFIKVGFNCGCPKMEKIIHLDKPTKDFKTKSNAGLLNLLITTSVNEEGIDVPALNLVIRYDFPMTNCSFFQSKGRARHQISRYILMMDPKNPKEKFLLDNYLKFECSLKLKLKTENEWREGFHSSLVDDHDIGDVYHTGVATLLEQDAIAILQTYLAKLPSDFFTQTKANFIEFEREIVQKQTNLETIFDSFGLNANQADLSSGMSSTAGQFVYFYIFIFPTNCSISGIVCGKIRSSKKSAKHSCAFQACKLLLERGELDQHLNVVEEGNLIRKHSEELNLVVVDKDNQQPQQSKLPLSYPCLKANYFTGKILGTNFGGQSKSEVFYQYSIDFQCCSGVPQKIDQCPLYKKAQICCNQSSFKLGFLSQIKLPTSTIESLIHFKLIQIPFKVRYNYEVRGLENLVEKFKLVQQFHRHMMDALFWQVDQLGSCNFLLVPLMNSLGYSTVIDMKLLTEFSKYNEKFDSFKLVKTNLDLIHLDDIDICDLSGPETLFTCLHHEKIPANIFHIKNFSSKFSNSTLDPKSSQTFEEYYKEKYNFQIVRQLTPLINAESSRKIFKSWNVVPNQASMTTPTESGISQNVLGENGHLLFPVEFTIRYPLNRSQYACISTFPTLFYRLEQYLIAFELMSKLSNEIGSLKLDFDTELSIDSLVTKKVQTIDQTEDKENRTSGVSEQQQQQQLNYGETFGQSFNGDISQFINSSFDTFDYVKCPNPWYIVKALTPKKANDLWNLERLETIGDSFLKMSTCLFLYQQYRNYDEGKLITLKDAIVCNENLYRLAIEKQLPKYMFAKSLLLFNQEQRKTIEDLMKLRHPINQPQTFKQELKRKDIADCVEALIGTFLIHGSAGSAVQFLRWIGIRSFDPNEVVIVDPVQFHQKQQQARLIELRKISDINFQRQLSSVIDFPRLVEQVYLKASMAEVEKIVQYQFKQKYYLIQAFTHPSLGNGTVDTENEITQLQSISSYQRLEFAGDAILDYLITHHIFSNKQTLTPFQISSLRSALVNNVFFASVTVKYGLHRYMRHSSQSLNVAVENFAKKFQNKSMAQLGTMLEESEQDPDPQSSVNSSQTDDNNNNNIIDEVDVPKALADIFESLIGAIFIDNRFSLDQVWKIVFRLIKPEIDYLLENIPMMPLALLQKEFLDRYKFSDIKIENQQMTILLSIDEQTFVGFGRNKKQCKLSAAKRALRHFGKMQIKL